MINFCYFAKLLGRVGFLLYLLSYSWERNKQKTHNCRILVLKYPWVCFLEKSLPSRTEKRKVRICTFLHCKCDQVQVASGANTFTIWAHMGMGAEVGKDRRVSLKASPFPLWDKVSYISDWSQILYVVEYNLRLQLGMSHYVLFTWWCV